MDVVMEELRRSLDDLKCNLSFDGWRIIYGGMRYAFISRELLMRITMELMKVLGPSLKSVVLQFTALSCFAEVSRMISSGTPPEEALEKYASFVGAGGWGPTKIVSADLEKPEVTVRMYNSSVASWFRENVEDLESVFPFYECAWWGYGWTGVVKAVMNGIGAGAPPLAYEETECLARGGKYCEWVITRGDAGLSQMEATIPKELFSYDSVRAVIGGNSAPGNPEESIRGFLNLLEVGEGGAVRVGGERVLLAPSILFSIAYFMLPVERFGDMIYAVYRRAHNEYGLYLSSQGEKYGVGGVLNFFLSSASSMGWGKMDVAMLDGSNLKLLIYQSLYGEEGGVYRRLKGLEPQPTCTLIGYIVEGILNYFAMKEGEPPFVAKEEKCIAKGDKNCEFTIQTL